MSTQLRFSVVVAAIALGAIGCGLTQSEEAEPVSSSKEAQYRLLDETCDDKHCLFIKDAEPDYPIGVATVTGYYARIERSAFGQAKECDSFIITEGPPVLIQSILSLIEQGNTVYAQNDAGQPVISLDLMNLMQSEEQRLISSSASEPVSVVLLATSPSYQDVPVCYSRFEILKVK